MSAVVRFALKEKALRAGSTNVLRVPVDALARDGETWTAFRVEHGRVPLRSVTIAGGGTIARFATTLRGDRVVMSPGDTLEEGVRARAGRDEDE